MIRRLAVAVAIVASISIFGFGAPAQAFSQCAAGTECGWLYYSDPAHSHWVGEYTTNCQGVVVREGVLQGYSVFVSQSCSGGLPPQ